MYARVVTFRGQPDKFQDGSRKLEETIPTLSKNPGFEDVYFLANHMTGNCIIVALWESEQTLQSASDAVKPVREEIARAFGSTEQPKVEVYEIIHQPGHMMRKAA